MSLETASLETALYTVLNAAIAAAEDGDVLFKAELHQTVYEPITKTFGVRIGDTNCDLAPGPGGAIDEWDILGVVQLFARVEDDTAAAVIAAREKVRALEMAVSQVLVDDPTLGNAINDCRILGGERGWGNVQGQRHAAANIHVIANETGKLGVD